MIVLRFKLIPLHLQNFLLGYAARLRLEELLELGQFSVEVSVRRVPSFRIDAGVGGF